MICRILIANATLNVLNFALFLWIGGLHFALTLTWFAILTQGILWLAHDHIKAALDFLILPPGPIRRIRIALYHHRKGWYPPFRDVKRWMQRWGFTYQATERPHWALSTPAYPLRPWTWRSHRRHWQIARPVVKELGRVPAHAAVSTFKLWWHLTRLR